MHLYEIFGIVCLIFTVVIVVTASKRLWPAVIFATGGLLTTASAIPHELGISRVEPIVLIPYTLGNILLLVAVVWLIVVAWHQWRQSRSLDRIYEGLTAKENLKLPQHDDTLI